MLKCFSSLISSSISTSFTSRGTLACKSRKSFSGFSQVVRTLRHFLRTRLIQLTPTPIKRYNIDALYWEWNSCAWMKFIVVFFFLRKILSFLSAKSTNCFKNLLSPRKHFLGHSLFPLLLSMLTCLIAILIATCIIKDVSEAWTFKYR